MSAHHSSLDVHWVPTETLSCDPANPRSNEKAIPHIAASLQRFGWQQPIVARRSGVVVAGNARLKSAASLGLELVPVVWFEGAESAARAYTVADNRTHEFAEWDDEALAAILEELKAEDSLEGVGFSEPDIDTLLADLESRLPVIVDDPGPQEPPASPVSKRGDLWILGGHRLLCGDSTSLADMEQLMDGHQARLLATDPPYLVDYRGADGSDVRGADDGGDHWDDYTGEEAGRDFFAGFLKVALANCAPSVPVYQWHAQKRQALVEAAWRECGLLLHQQIIWAKARGTLGRSDYMWQHEPCFYGWPKGVRPSQARRPAANLTTVWQINQAGQLDGIHPTQKPLRLFEIPIEEHTRPGEVVLEPFSGSGTQIIAAEGLSRRCFAMELAPEFVDAAVLRWQEATGKQALLDGCETPFASGSAA